MVYRVDAEKTEGGWSLDLPLPEAASVQLDAYVPGQGLEMHKRLVAPAAGSDGLHPVEVDPLLAETAEEFQARGETVSDRLEVREDGHLYG